jgi:hypothetical protein
VRPGRFSPASRAARGAIALCCGALLVLPGCGGDDEGDPIPARYADQLIAKIESADQRSADGTCQGAQANVRQAQDILENRVPRSVDKDVRQGIADGLERMLNLIQTECQRRDDTQTDTTETTETETVPTVTETQTTTTVTPTETETQPTTTQPTTTTTTPTTPTPTTGNGGTPPGQVGGGVGVGEGDG